MIERDPTTSSLIFVGCASPSPAAYERGINYPREVCFFCIFLSLSFPLMSLVLSLSRFDSLTRLPWLLLFVAVCSSLSARRLALSPPRQGVYNDSSWWDDTGSEVRTAEPDVHSMESLSSTGKRGSSLKEVAIHARTRRSFQHEGRKIRFLRHSRERESRANSLEQRGKICARR